MIFAVLGDVKVQHYWEEGDEGRDGPDEEEQDGDRPDDDGHVSQADREDLCDLLVIQLVYCSGSLILMYLSRAIIQRLSMEAVEHITSQLKRDRKELINFLLEESVHTVTQGNILSTFPGWIRPFLARTFIFLKSK